MYSFDKFHELIAETIDKNPFSKNPEKLASEIAQISKP